MQRKELLLPSSSSSMVVPSFARGINIMVVDHETTSLLYLASMLEQYSFKVTTTEVASVALSMIRQEKDRFKLVMANINMFDTNSLLYFQELLKEEIPVILMSSKRSKVVSRSLVEGACFFLEKPICFDDLKYVWQHAYKRRIKIRSEKNHKQMEVGAQVLILDENSAKQSENYYYCKEQHLMGSDQSQNQGGFKTKRSLLVGDNDDDDDDEGEMQNGIKKRKLNCDFYENSYKFMMIPTEEIGEEMNVNNNENVKRKSKPRLIWTPELHLKFMEAISALGDTRARPKQILQMMNVPGLTQRQVASHLQKYKTQAMRISVNATTDLPSTSISKPSSILAPNTRSFQYLEKIIRPSVAYQPTVKSNVFAAEEKRQAGGFNGSGGSSNLAYAGNHQEVNATAVLETPAAASSVNQDQPSFQYAEILKLLEEEDEDEDEIKAGLLGGEPKPADLDRYCEWLAEAFDGRYSLHYE